MKKNEHLITVVYPGSIAEEMEIETGDYLLAINDKEIKDTINAVTVAEVFTHLKKEVDEYYGASN